MKLEVEENSKRVENEGKLNEKSRYMWRRLIGRYRICRKKQEFDMEKLTILPGIMAFVSNLRVL